MAYGEGTHHVDPPVDVLPNADEMRTAMAYLEDAPGNDMYASIANNTTDQWPDNGYHISANLRPGFNGNVTITPYQQAEFTPATSTEQGLGRLTLHGCGLFVMVYDNPAHIVDIDPSRRLGPDFASLGLGLHSGAETVALHNGGRLIVSERPTAATGGISTQWIEEPRPSRGAWEGIVVIQKLAKAKQVTSIIGAIGSSLALDEEDRRIFIAQPMRKIQAWPSMRAGQRAGGRN